ncbi:translation initiation factor IF-2 subunit gamma, partial [Candidatus Woesearchaeota archaeon]|nr:translation initiation factor IF-2 subunit gamma [Candidatus Woesearchaeota archaeon]
GKCPEPFCYTTKEICPKCNEPSVPIRKVSFVDAPGHESLMATMLAGATIMDGAFLLISAAEKCPQPQTREHLMALEIIGVKNVIAVQNKIDLVSEEQAQKNYGEIQEFLKNTIYKDIPIIPISAQHRVGLEFLLQAIQEFIPTPKRDSSKEPIMLIARSFDINKPGIKPSELVGGVLGGSLRQGVLKANDQIEIKPGRKVKEKNKDVWKPIRTTIASINSGGLDLEHACPGGSIGIMTALDPSIVKSDQLTGSLAGLPGKLPNTWTECHLKVKLLQRVVGAESDLKVEPIKMNEFLMLNVNSAATVGVVSQLKKDSVRCVLKVPVCAESGSRVTISRRIGNRFRLIGYGEIF